MVHCSINVSLIKIALSRCNTTEICCLVGFPWRRLTNHPQHSKSLLPMTGLCCGFQTPLAERCDWLADLRTGWFLRTKAATAFQHVLAIAILSVCLSVHPSVRSSVTRVDQSNTVQARITKSSPSAAWKTLVSGTLKLFHKFEGGHLKW